MNSNLFSKSLQWVLALDLLQFIWRVLVDELVDGEVATTDSDLDARLVDLDGNLTRAKLVHAFTLAEEHDLELLAIRVVVDKLSKFHVDLVILVRNVNRNLSLQIDDVRLQSFDFLLSLLKLFQQVETRDVRLVHLLFQLLYVVGLPVDLITERLVLALQGFNSTLSRDELFLDVTLDEELVAKRCDFGSLGQILVGKV